MLNYQEYTSLFDKLNYLLGQLDVSNCDKEVNRRQIADLGRLVTEYRSYLMLSEKFELQVANINDASRLFYVDFSKLVDLLARLYCNSREFLRACEMVEANVMLLENIYKSADSRREQFSIELANEYFKLAEIQFNCQFLPKALTSVNKAIVIGEKVYSSDNSLLVDFHSLKDNIQSII